MENKDFEKITIEKIDGKRIITIDGEEIDLSDVTEFGIFLSEDLGIEIETVHKNTYRW